MLRYSLGTLCVKPVILCCVDDLRIAFVAALSAQTEVFLEPRKPSKHWKKEVNNLPVAFDTRLWNKEKLHVPS